MVGQMNCVPKDPLTKISGDRVFKRYVSVPKEKKMFADVPVPQTWQAVKRHCTGTECSC